ncbi:Protein involved in initiation of plasmid replication [Moraxella caprae]|uniref:Protein involved in initiation of plasmid replication n=1 Tax=Moraxella caprae TaxID=90240 RepID=A0A378U7M4_9GAMM|nr:replication initiation protein [Moraxella caprae]STZ70243.1 Protein involved in initiation of plasmid replication [Moraxella caprae]
MSKDLIVKANDLVVAGYELTANEQRLILTAIAKISPTQLDPNTGYEITAKEFQSD